MMFFASMMSFMGMGMNPTESSMTEGQIDQSGAEGAATDTGDAGASDMDTSGGEADFGGFDGGGFGDFWFLPEKNCLRFKSNKFLETQCR